MGMMLISLKQNQASGGDVARAVSREGGGGAGGSGGVDTQRHAG